MNSDGEGVSQRIRQCICQACAGVADAVVRHVASAGGASGRAGAGGGGEGGRWGAAMVVGGGVAALGYFGVATGAVTLDLGVGRRVRQLSVAPVDIRASKEVVFGVLGEPYLGRQTRAVAEKITVLERGSDMVLAAHRTPVGAGLVAVTV